jgi:hypothetical protein
MKRAVVVGVIVMVMIVTVGLVASNVEAREYGAGVSGSKASLNAALRTASLMMTTSLADWYAWLLYQLRKYLGSVYPEPHHWNHYPKGSVPIPGTLIPLAGGIGALVAWWERRRRL